MDDSNVSSSPTYNKVFSFIAALVFLCIALSYLLYDNYTLRSEVRNLNQQLTQVNVPVNTPQTDVSQSIKISDITNVEKVIYQDPEGRFQFEYPSTWNIITQIPEQYTFKYYPIKANDDEYQMWLESKMFVGECSGPVLQHKENPNILIAFEIKDSKSSGAFCWSSGSFEDNNKWRISNGYVYPAGSNNHYDPEWKGDFSVMKDIDSNEQYSVFAVLVNLQTYTLDGTVDFDHISSTFNFSPNTTR